MRWEPTNPAPPVTSNVWLTNFLPLRRSAAKDTHRWRPHSNQRVGPHRGDESSVRSRVVVGWSDGELPGGRGGWRDDRGTVVAGDRVRQHPRREPAAVVAAQVG